MEHLSSLKISNKQYKRFQRPCCIPIHILNACYLPRVLTVLCSKRCPNLRNAEENRLLYTSTEPLGDIVYSDSKLHVTLFWIECSSGPSILWNILQELLMWLIAQMSTLVCLGWLNLIERVEWKKINVENFLQQSKLKSWEQCRSLGLGQGWASTACGSNLTCRLFF